MVGDAGNGAISGHGHMDRGPAPAPAPTSVGRCGRGHDTRLAASRGALESPWRCGHFRAINPGADCVRHGACRRARQCDALGIDRPIRSIRRGLLMRAPRNAGPESLADQLRQGAIHQPADSKGWVVYPALFGDVLLNHRDHQLVATLRGMCPASSPLVSNQKCLLNLLAAGRTWTAASASDGAGTEGFLA